MAQSGLVQWAISPDTSVQMELAHRRREYGDLVSRFDPDAFGTERNTDNNDDVRFGLRDSFDPSSNLLVAFNRRDDKFAADFGISVHTRSSRVEAQHLLRAGAFSLVSGVSWFEEDNRRHLRRHRRIEAAPPHALCVLDVRPRAGLDLPAGGRVVR